MQDGGARSAKACLTEPLPIQDANAFEVNCPRPDSEVNVTRWFLGLYPSSEIEVEHQDRRVWSCRSRGLQNEPRVVSTYSSLRLHVSTRDPFLRYSLLTFVCCCPSNSDYLFKVGRLPVLGPACLPSHFHALMCEVTLCRVPCSYC